ncbi:MAG TPA: amino acid adenylation domain-containing protein [Solirubrobacteraceae bacterium]|nr:amino acid adenylation domain-containing protein [Solirubrobacteraceae bacterium]
MLNETTLTIPRGPGDGPRPLSFPQERLFLLDRLLPGLGAYNVPTLVRVHGTLDAELLRRACELVVERQEILRSAIRLIDGIPAAEVMPPRRFELSELDVREVPVAERESRAHGLLADIVQRPFDLGSDVLLRVALLHFSDDEDRLLIVLHHIGSDHVSSAILFSELDAIYGAYADGRQPELPELPIQYADYATWQRDQLTGSHLEELVDYWTERLKGAPERLDLPFDRPRPSTQSYRGKLQEFALDRELVAPLRELARSQGVSMFMLLTAAFKALVHRYTGVDDVVLGGPSSGRQYEETTGLLGFFTNWLVLRTDLSGDPTFAELLSRVKLTTLEAQIYQELPFERLVEALNPERVQSHSPLFQVLFSHDIAPAESPRIAGRVLEQMPLPGWEWARLDLSVFLRELPSGDIQATLEYATDLFDDSTIARMFGHYTTLLEGVLRDPGQRLSQLPLLTAAERELMLVQWNDTAHEYDCRPIHELVADQVARTPDRIAVVDSTERLTYGELQSRANQLAHELVAAGVQPGSLVGICMDRSAALMVSMLGVLQTGAAYVPIDPTFPPQRQEFMLADAKAPVLITQERFLGVIDPKGARVICVDRDWPRIAAQPQTPLGIAVDPESTAYVIYTSGSTGNPKGVLTPHRGVANLLAYMRETPGMTEDDVIANVATQAVDLPVPDFYLTLMVGARLVTIPRDATMDGVDLADWMARSGATIMAATATTWQLLVDAGWKGSPALKIEAGGEALPRALAEELRSRCDSLWNVYGPTETTVWSSVLELQPGEGSPPIGGPLWNTTFYVLDAGGQPLPIGVAGELYIGGDGLALGYLNRPELTAEKFVADPFSSEPGARLYRTGDLVRWREDSTLEYLGRVDLQVKLRGFRIELEEIEAVLDTHPDVAGAAVVVREFAPGDQRLVAYAVPVDGHELDVEALRRMCKTKLAPYMVPSTFVVLEEFPTTPNRKLDRKALPAPDGHRPDMERAYTPPQTPLEETLVSIWREALGVDRVGIDDDFFDLGGHSLLAVKMLARVQQDLGVDLYLGSVFDHSTVRELAVAVSERMVGETEADELSELLAEIEASEL